MSAHNFRRTLIAGTGPVALQLAVVLKTSLAEAVGLAGRRSARAAAVFSQLQANDRLIHAEVGTAHHQALAGECRVDELYPSYAEVTGAWTALVMAVTADAYLEVLQQLRRVTSSGALACVVLVSPTLGSAILVRSHLRAHGVDAEVISLSSYLGDTRWAAGDPSPHVLTLGVKNRVYIGSTCAGSPNLAALCGVHEQLGVTATVMAEPTAAETRNISLYVHPPLVMNDTALEAVFAPPSVPRYLYKLFPEGPITPALITTMVAQWQELTQLVEKLGIAGVNLLRMMVEDSYPVRPESISPDDIDRFESLPRVHQEYLVYVRYASLLIDPFSQPDSEGHYVDFSAVRLRPTVRDSEGRWDIPRVPGEDYYRTKIIQGIAGQLNIATPTIDGLIATYERWLRRAASAFDGAPKTAAFTVRHFREDLELICAEIGSRPAEIAHGC